MAKCRRRSLDLVRVAVVVGFLLFSSSLSEAKELVVGGKTDAWKIPPSSSSPPDESSSLNQWAQASRFQVGDILVWKYDAKEDSVLQVSSRKDYVNCNISSPIAQYNDGNTKVKLHQPGPYYFISGAKGHCEKGQKIIIVVMSPRSTVSSSSSSSISPAPSPIDDDGYGYGPAVAPSSGGAAAATAQPSSIGGLGILMMLSGLVLLF